MAIFPYFMSWKCPYIGGWVVLKSPKTPLRNIKMVPYGYWLLVIDGKTENCGVNEYVAQLTVQFVTRQQLASPSRWAINCWINRHTKSFISNIWPTNIFILSFLPVSITTSMLKHIYNSITKEELCTSIHWDTHCHRVKKPKI